MEIHTKHCCSLVIAALQHIESYNSYSSSHLQSVEKTNKKFMRKQLSQRQPENVGQNERIAGHGQSDEEKLHHQGDVIRREHDSGLLALRPLVRVHRNVKRRRDGAEAFQDSGLL